MRSTIPGVAGTTGTHLHGPDLFYVDCASAAVLKITIPLPTGLPTGPANLITTGTLIDDFTLTRIERKREQLHTPESY